MRIQIRDVPQELHRRYKAKCAMHGTSIQQQTLELIARWVDEDELDQVAEPTPRYTDGR